MGSTPTWHLPWPELADPADGPDGYQDLAVAVDAALTTAAGTAAFLIGTEATRPPAAPGNNGSGYYATDSGRLYVSDGTKWMLVISGSQAVTTLPSSPSDGQEVDLVDNVANPSWRFRLRYNAARTTEAGAYKWERVAGEYLADQSGPSMGALVPTYNATLTSGPVWTAPRSGVYSLVAEAYATVNAVNGGTNHRTDFTLVWNGAVVMSEQALVCEVVPNNANVSQVREDSISVAWIGTLLAGQTVQFRTTSGPNATGLLAPHSLIVRPLRVG